jgi:hypothetical protein
MKNVLIVYRLIVLLALILLQAWQVNAAYRDTNDFCKGAPCHTGTAGTTEGVPVSETDDKVHDSCSDCHDPNSGSLVGSAAGREGHEVNMCIDCHGGPARFLSHQHHENLNKVSYDDGVNDTSQPGHQGCGDCHGSGPQGGPYSLASWSDILFVHNNSCYTCHDYANEPSVGDNTPFLADVQFAIANPGSGLTCATCHKPKVPDTSHGSHSLTDFVRTANCTTACHPSPDGIGEMHVALRGDCGDCHESTSGGGDLVASITGATTSSSCADCHGSSDPSTVHHGGTSAQNGDCLACHNDPRPAAGQRVIAAMVCSECHVQMNGSTMEIVAITYAKEGSAEATGVDSGNTYTPITTGNGFSSDHTFPNSGGVIQNYGVCLECHGHTGKTGYTSAPRMFPYHALPKPGAYSASDNTIGGNGWNNNLGNNGAARFRGNLNWDSSAPDSYFPVGKGRLDIGYAMHSLPEMATQNSGYKVANKAAATTYNTMAAGLTFGTVMHPTNSVTYFIPNFDPICTSSNGCDDLTVNTAVTTIGSRPNVGFDLQVTSSTSATLHVVWGGRHLGSFSSGSTFSFRWAEQVDPGCSNRCDMQNSIPIDSFSSTHSGPVWVVSEDGGAVNAGTPDAMEWANFDVIQTGLTNYPGTDWPQQ